VVEGEVPHDNPIHTEVVVVVVTIVDMMIVRGGMSVLIMMVEGTVDTIVREIEIWLKEGCARKSFDNNLHN
jgi:hypothetical protein